MPTAIESHKTIDNKTFYKTTEICQLLICKEGRTLMMGKILTTLSSRKRNLIK